MQPLVFHRPSTAMCICFILLLLLFVAVVCCCWHAIQFDFCHHSKARHGPLLVVHLSPQTHQSAQLHTLSTAAATLWLQATLIFLTRRPFLYSLKVGVYLIPCNYTQKALEIPLPKVRDARKKLSRKASTALLPDRGLHSLVLHPSCSPFEPPQSHAVGTAQHVQSVTYTQERCQQSVQISGHQRSEVYRFADTVHTGKELMTVMTPGRAKHRPSLQASRNTILSMLQGNLHSRHLGWQPNRALSCRTKVNCCV